MTRDEHRNACIMAMCTAYERETGSPADWNGMMEAFDTLHNIVRVNPVEATKEMIDEFRYEFCYETYDGESDDPEKIIEAVLAIGDLTNPLEK